MSLKKLLFLSGIILISKISTAQLSVDIEGMRNYKGQVVICLYTENGGFLDQEKALKVSTIEAANNFLAYKMKTLPPNDYALCIYHDENMNNKLDRNKKGTPKEAVGFSNNVYWDKKKPEFASCAFTYEGKPLFLTVKMK